MTEATNYESVEKDHSTRGPSSAHRWINCTGSPNLIAKLMTTVADFNTAPNPAASEGTAAHSLLLDICLTNGEDAWEHAGRVIEADGLKFTVDAEMQEGVQEALDFIREKLAQHPTAILIIERRVASPEGSDTFGSLDVGILVPGERLIIIDFKYGRKVVVEPTEEQLKLYGHYTFETFATWKNLRDILGLDITGHDEDAEVFPDRNTVCQLYILQPRIPHPEGTKRRFVTSKTELARFFYGEAFPAYQQSFEADAPLTVGDWCRWCPAMEFCPAINKKKEEFFLGDPIVLTNEQLNDACINLEQIIAQGKKLQAELYRRSLSGGKFKDWKLVHKMGDRVWKAGAEIELRETYGEDAYTAPELKSPAAIERMEGGKKLATKWGMKPDTGLTIAPMKDRRKAATAPMADFDKQMGNVEDADG